MNNLPFETIREMCLDDLLAAMRDVQLTEEQKQDMGQKAFKILETKEFCRSLGIDWIDPTYEQGKRADYGSVLI